MTDIFEDSRRSGLMTADDLARHLAESRLRVLDATWVMPGSGRDARAEYVERHIPGARRFDLDAIADRSNPLPHMLPDAATFAAKVQELGIGSDSLVVVYDSYGLMSAARAWWMFRVFGHADVAVLDGGLPAWTGSGHATESGEPPPPPPGRFAAKFRPELVRSAEQIHADLPGVGERVVDARGAGRFSGRDAEPWPGRRSGHIPGSVNLPYTDLLDGNGRVRPEHELRAAFAARGLIDDDHPKIASCGSGVTACVLALAAHRLGLPEMAVYDGSWAEWGLDNDLPVATGDVP